MPKMSRTFGVPISTLRFGGFNLYFSLMYFESEKSVFGGCFTLPHLNSYYGTHLKHFQKYKRSYKYGLLEGVSKGGNI